MTTPAPRGTLGVDPESLTPKEVAILRSSVVVTLTKREDIPIYVDDSAHTAHTDMKSIWLTKQNIAEPVRKHKDISFSLYKGLTAHECGHILWTTPVWTEEKKWMDRKHKCPLSKMVLNIIEDKRIDTKLMAMYRHSVGANILDWTKTEHLLWLYTKTVKFDKLKKEKTLDPAMPPDGPEFVNVCILCGSLFVDSKEVFKLIDKYFPKFPAEWKKDIELGIKTVEMARFYKQWRFFLEVAAENLFNIMKKYAPPGGGGGGGGGDGDGEGPDGQPPGGPPRPGDGPPKIIKGGGITPSIYPKPYGTEEPEIPPDYVPPPGDDDPGEGKTGTPQKEMRLTDSPVPNEPAYRARRDRLASIISRMKNRLKAEARPKYEQERWKRQGRMMQGIMALAYVNAPRTPMTNIYQSNIMRLEKSELTLSLVVDLSGSTPLQTMIDVLTIIAEVAGGWLPDHRWAIYAFGDSFQKIKNFEESYSNTKARIGGLDYLGGTELATALQKVSDDYRTLKAPGPKVNIIVSDFELYGDDPERTRGMIKKMDEMGIRTICIAHDRSVADTAASARLAKSMCDKVVEMPMLSDLPDKFFEVYKGIAFDIRGKRWVP